LEAMFIRDDHYQVIFWNMENIVSIRRYEFVRVASVEILEMKPRDEDEDENLDAGTKKL
jgi:hypothetical protein